MHMQARVRGGGYVGFEAHIVDVEALKAIIADRIHLPPSEFKVILAGKVLTNSVVKSPDFRGHCHALNVIIKVDLERFKGQITNLRGKIERYASITMADEDTLAKLLTRLESWRRTLEKYERNTCAEPEPQSEIFDSLVGLEVRRLKQIREEIANIEFFRCESLISNRNFRLPYEMEARLKQLLEQKNEIKACFQYNV